MPTWVIRKTYASLRRARRPVKPTMVISRNTLAGSGTAPTGAANVSVNARSSPAAIQVGDDKAAKLVLLLNSNVAVGVGVIAGRTLHSPE